MIFNRSSAPKQRKQIAATNLLYSLFMDSDNIDTHNSGSWAAPSRISSSSVFH